jgi:hypothetical protein
MRKKHVTQKYFTTGDTAKYLNISHQHLNRLAKEGIVKKEELGYDLQECIRAYVKFKIDEEKKRYQDKLRKHDDPQYRIQEYNAELKRMEVERTQGRLIDADDVLQSLSQIIIRTRNSFMELRKLAPRLRSMTSIKNISDLLDKEIRRVLKELSDEGKK